MKHVDAQAIAKAVPVEQMSRQDKLTRWAKLVEKTDRPLNLYHGVEYMKLSDLRRAPIHATDPTAFGVAMSDAILNDAGLPRQGSMGELMDFFSLSQHDLHEFSCDCGGGISAGQMASRINHLARDRFGERPTGGARPFADHATDYRRTELRMMDYVIEREPSRSFIDHAVTMLGELYTTRRR